MDSKKVIQKWFEYCKAAVAMVVVQLFTTGVQLLSRIVLKQGIYIFAFMAYRTLVAALVVAPLSLYFERDDIRKKLSWTVFLWLFINASTGITLSMMCFNYGLRDTTAGYTVNFLNLVPFITFLLSVAARVEKLGLKSRAGQLKVAGTIISTGGALTVGLYKGHGFHIGHHHIHIAAVSGATAANQHNWARVSLLLCAGSVSIAVWYIVQAKLLKAFPYKFWATTLGCLIGSVQAAVVGLCIDHRSEAWKLGWDLQLATIVYSGAIGTAGVFCLVSWVVETQGPAYPSMFSPLVLLFVLFSEALLLGELITVGSLIGMVLIIAGLYSFLWGRRHESTSLSAPVAASEEGDAVGVVAHTPSPSVATHIGGVNGPIITPTEPSR